MIKADKKLEEFFSPMEKKILKFYNEAMQYMDDERLSGMIDPMYMEKISVMQQIFKNVHINATLRKDLAEQEIIAQKFMDDEFSMMLNNHFCMDCMKKTSLEKVGEELDWHNWMCNIYQCVQCKSETLILVPNNWPDFYKFKLAECAHSKANVEKMKAELKDKKAIENYQLKIEKDLLMTILLNEFEKKRLKRIKMIKENEEDIKTVYEIVEKTRNSILKPYGLNNGN